MEHSSFQWTLKQVKFSHMCVSNGEELDFIVQTYFVVTFNQLKQMRLVENYSSSKLAFAKQIQNLGTWNLSAVAPIDCIWIYVYQNTVVLVFSKNLISSVLSVYSFYTFLVTARQLTKLRKGYVFSRVCLSSSVHRQGPHEIIIIAIGQSQVASVILSRSSPPLPHVQLVYLDFIIHGPPPSWTRSN